MTQHEEAIEFYSLVQSLPVVIEIPDAGEDNMFYLTFTIEPFDRPRAYTFCYTSYMEMGEVFKTICDATDLSPLGALKGMIRNMDKMNANWKAWEVK